MRPKIVMKNQFISEDKMSLEWADLKVERIFLDQENPRFPTGKVASQNDVIELLCKDEYVLGLAKDIVKYGVNPLELFGVIKDLKLKKDLGQQTYIVVEGNRRMCALKLLVDPELAPDKYKKTFAELSEQWSKIDTVSCCIFEDRQASKIWLERLHGDLNGGIGRKKWTAEQKQRFSGDSRNARAQKVLDYAQNTMKIITEEQRKQKLTTAQRYLGNPLVRETLGIDNRNSDKLFIIRPKEEFEKRLNQFIKDLISGEKVHSRGKKNDFIEYAWDLRKNVPVSDAEIEPTFIDDAKITPATSNSSQTSDASDKNDTFDKQPRFDYIARCQKINHLLTEVGNLKLTSLYYSICKIKLRDSYIPILTIGCWAFIESLSAAAGRNEKVSFTNFYSKQKLDDYGIKGNYRSYLDALNRLEGSGNTTKHHFISASFNGPQLANDMQCLEPIIEKTLLEIVNKKKMSS